MLEVTFRLTSCLVVELLLIKSVKLPNLHLVVLIFTIVYFNFHVTVSLRVDL